MKRMKHPQHGWTHAGNANEEAYLRARGWGDDHPPEEVKAAPQGEQDEGVPPAPTPTPVPDGAAPIQPANRKHPRKRKA